MSLLILHIFFFSVGPVPALQGVHQWDSAAQSGLGPFVPSANYTPAPGAGQQWSTPQSGSAYIPSATYTPTGQASYAPPLASYVPPLTSYPATAQSSHMASYPGTAQASHEPMASDLTDQSSLMASYGPNAQASIATTGVVSAEPPLPVAVPPRPPPPPSTTATQERLLQARVGYVRSIQILSW